VAAWPVAEADAEAEAEAEAKARAEANAEAWRANPSSDINKTLLAQ
jgi:hypothetical protein